MAFQKLFLRLLKDPLEIAAAHVGPLQVKNPWLTDIMVNWAGTTSMHPDSF